MWNQGDGRGDWNISDKDFVFGRYSRQDTTDDETVNVPERFLTRSRSARGFGNEGTFAGDSALVAHHAVLSWTRTLTPTFLMDAKMGFNRFNLDYRQEGAVEGARLGEKLGIPNANQGPQANGIPDHRYVRLSGHRADAFTSDSSRRNTFHPTVTFTNLRGRHTFKYGLDCTPPAVEPVPDQSWQRTVQLRSDLYDQSVKRPLTPATRWRASCLELRR